MSSISTRRALAVTHPFAGRQWYYGFRELEGTLGEDSCMKMSNRMLKRYGSRTKTWNPEANSEWACRLFMAAKLIMASTLHVNSAIYAENRNLRVVLPYLRYYSILCLLRSVCYTLPEHEWNNGQLIHISHSAAIKGALNHLRGFNKAVADAAERDIRLLKAEREFISYRAPSSGDDQVSDKNRFLFLCTLLAEVAQFNSELFEASLLKHADSIHFKLLPDYGDKIANVEIDGHYFGDWRDTYRLDYLMRKHPMPANLQHFMTEGHVDDFFGVWCAEDDTGGLFDPDEMIGIIFDILP